MNNRRHRREFVRSIVLGASAATTAPLLADEPKEPKPPELKTPQSETDARMELVLARFGRHLDANERDAVRFQVEGIVHRAEQLRKFALDNGDGPMPAFVPYRAPLVEEK